MDKDANSYSPLTWYFNHETNVFSSGPSLLQGRNSHGSATIVDKVTKAKIPMVTGGYNGGTLDSTELLINGIWQSGTIQYPKNQPCFERDCSFFFAPSHIRNFRHTQIHYILKACMLIKLATNELFGSRMSKIINFLLTDRYVITTKRELISFQFNSFQFGN